MSTKNKKENKQIDLPNFVKTQLEIINSLQNRVNQLNKDFEIEKACKNQVYEFIFKNGYFDEYVKFNKSHPVQY